MHLYVPAGHEESPAHAQSCRPSEPNLARRHDLSDCVFLLSFVLLTSISIEACFHSPSGIIRFPCFDWEQQKYCRKEEKGALSKGAQLNSIRRYSEIKVKYVMSHSRKSLYVCTEIDVDTASATETTAWL